MNRLAMVLVGIGMQGVSVVCNAADVVRDDQEYFVTTDRYTQASIKPRSDQLSPLDTLVNFAFSDEISTVGGAIREMLEGSGYAWSAPAGVADDARLNQLPLPVINRDIGPVRLRDGLATVAGVAWQLNVDELNRVIWFSIKGQQTAVPEKTKKARCYGHRC